MNLVVIRTASHKALFTAARTELPCERHIELHARTKGPSFAAMSAANRYEVGRDADACDQSTIE